MTGGAGSLRALWSVAALKSNSVDKLSAIATGATLDGADILAAVGTDGAKYVLFPQPPAAGFQEDVESAGVQLRERTLVADDVAQCYAALSCTMPWLEDAFEDIASECISRVAGQQSRRPDLVVHAVLEEWRELLAKQSRQRLGDDVILGLIGELDMLAELAEVDPVGAIAAWTGPGGEIHDFCKGSLALEVKASRRRHGRAISINGVEQLLPPSDGRLYLRFVRAERIPSGRITLSALAERVVRAGVSKPMLNKSLTLLGLRIDDLGAYDDFAVNIVERRTYAVNESFPRIVPASFVGSELPQGVVSLTYTIELTQEPPFPLSPKEVVQLRKELVG